MADLNRHLKFSVGNAADLPVFNLKNGAITEVRSIIVRPTIPRAFMWRPIGGVTHENAKDHMDLFIRTAMAALALNQPEGWDGAKARKASILLGTVRCVTTFLYRIEEADLVAGEREPRFFTVETNAAGVVTVTLENEMPEDLKGIMRQDMALTDDEKNVIATVATFAGGILPLQGYSLFQCQHHYLSDAKSKSFKAYRTVEKQFWRSPAVRTFFEADTDMCRDVLWHKACHPIQILFKMNMAGSARIKESLKIMGVGSAAARLPALEPIVRAAFTWITVLSTVRNYFVGYGGTLDYFVLVFALEVVSQFPMDSRVVVESPMLMKTDVMNDVTYTAPAEIKDRSDALKWLSDIMTTNSAVMTTAYGFYVALSEKNQMMCGEAVHGTLKGAFSLSKLKSQSMTSYMLGFEAYKEGAYDPIRIGITM